MVRVSAACMTCVSRRSSCRPANGLARGGWVAVSRCRVGCVHAAGTIRRTGVANAGLPLARRLFEGQEWVVERMKTAGVRKVVDGSSRGIAQPLRLEEVMRDRFG